MKSDVYYIPDNINETGELSLFYEDKKKLENGEGCLIDIPECYINLLGDGIYSASDGKSENIWGMRMQPHMMHLEIMRKIR